MLREKDFRELILNFPKNTNKLIVDALNLSNNIELKVWGKVFKVFLESDFDGKRLYEVRIGGKEVLSLNQGISAKRIENEKIYRRGIGVLDDDSLDIIGYSYTSDGVAYTMEFYGEKFMVGADEIDKEG